MITAINSATSFKKIYKPNDNPFSKLQMRAVDDIEKKLANKAKEKDFLIEPGGKNGVELYRLYGVREHNYKTAWLDCTYDKKVFCAYCDVFNPLIVEDIDLVENIDLVEENHINAQACLNVAKNILIAILASAALIGGAIAVRNKIHAKEAQTEFIQKADTLKNNLIQKIK